MDSFVDTFGHVIKRSEKLENGEHLFVVGWIDRYLLECPKNRRGPLIKILLDVLENCSRLDDSRIESGGSIRTLMVSLPAENVIDLVEFSFNVDWHSHFFRSRLILRFYFQVLTRSSTLFGLSWLAEFASSCSSHR